MKYSHLLSRYILWATLLLLGTGRAAAQSWNLVNNDTLVIDACQTSTGTIYDDGGPDGNYSNYFNGWVVITTQPGVSISLGGSYVTESCCDYLDVWDGDPNTGTQLVYHAGGTGSITADITATSGQMTIKFRSDGSVVNAGFALNYSLSGGTLDGLTVNNVTNSSAILSWITTEPGPYHVMLDDQEVGATSETVYTLNGLYASRRYNVTVYPEGQADNRCVYMGAEFRTPCGITQVPLVEDFNDLTAELMPPCWISSTNFDELTTQPRLIDMGSEGNSLMVSCGANNTGGHYGMVISPIIADTGTQWTVSFDYRVSHSNTVLEVGVCDSMSPEYLYYGFTPLGSINVSNNTEWRHYREVLTIPTNGCRLAFRMIQSSQSGVGHMAYIDNLSMEDCGINEASTSQTDTTSVKLSWTLVGTPTVSVGVRREGMDTDDTVISNAVSPLVVDDLLPDTRYTLRLYPECGGIYGFTYAVSVHTIAATGLQTSLCETPTDYVTLRDGWTTGSTNSNTCSLGSSVSMYNGTYLITPPMEDLGGKRVTVSFYTSSYYYTSSHLVVGTVTYADDYFSSFTPIDTLSPDASYIWQESSVEVPAGCTDRFVAFYYYSSSGSSLEIWKIGINSCVEVDGARITEIHNNSVTVAWDNPSMSEDTVLIGYRYSTATPFFYDTVVGAIQHTLTGLYPDYNITIRVRRPCVEDCDFSDLQIHTPRRPQMLCENFDGNYSSIFNNSNTYWWYRSSTYNSCPDTSTRHNHSSSRSIIMESYYSYPLNLPYIDSIGGKVLSFWAYSLAPSSQLRLHSDVQRARKRNPPNFYRYTFNNVNIVGDGMWHHYSVILPDTVTGRLALSYLLTSSTNQGIYNLWLDDVQLGSCGYGDFSFANLTSHSVNVVWQSLGATASRIRLEGANGHVVDTIVLPDTAYIDGLDSTILYRCYMAPILGTDTLCLSYAGRFYTPMYSESGSDGNGSGSSGGFDYTGVVRCNSMWENDTLPKGWFFSDSSDIQVSSGTMRITPSLTADTIFLPPFQASALYIAARGLSVSDTLFVDGDTIVLDTVWHHYCHEPDPTPGHRVELQIRTGSATGGCELDNVGFSNCPIIDFTPNGNRILCHVRDIMYPELMLTLTDEDGVSHDYYISTQNYTIDGLKPSTTYSAEWHCLYMSDGCMPTLKVRTEAVPVPYCVDFSNGNNAALPNGWKMIGRNNDYAQSYSNYQYRFYSSYNYSYSPQYHIYNNHWQYIVLPETEESNNLTVTLYGHDIGSYQQLEIGVLTNPTDTSTFVTAASFSYPDASPYVADLSQLPQGRVTIRNMAGYLDISRVQLFDAPMITSKHLYHYDSLIINTASVGNYGFQYEYRSSNYTDFYTPSTMTVDTTSYKLPLQNYSNSNRYLMLQQTNADGATDCFSQPTNIPIHRAKNVPYCEDFQNSSNYNYAFHQVYNNQCGVWFRSSSYYTNEYYLSASIYQTQTFSLPYMLVDSVEKLVVGFKYRSIPSSNNPINTSNFLVAGVLIDALDSSSFIPTDTIEMIMDGEWHPTTMDFASYQGEGRWIALRDIYNTNSHTLYLDDFLIDICYGAHDATATLERYNVVRIDNTREERFYVEYGPRGFVRGNGTLTAIDSTPYHLTLTPETEYEFYFYCDSLGAPCAKSQKVTTLAPPLDVPVCVDFDTCTVDQGPAFWTHVTETTIVSDTLSHSTGNSLMVLGTVATPDINIDSLQEISLGLWVMTTEPGTRLMVGSMITPADVATFHNLKTIVPEQVGVWEHHFVSFANAPTNAHFIALRNSSGDSRTLFVDDLHFTTCAAFDLHVDHLDNNTLDLSWTMVGAPTISFAVDDEGMPSAYTPMSNILSIPITPLHGYTITMHSTCMSTMACNVDYDDTIHIVAPVEGTGCVNSTDLQSPQAVFYSGSYLNPYSAAGAIDCGSRSPDSRHTVCYDTTERDPRTGGLLRTIPEGYTSSVRLGNWSTNYTSPEAEGVLYSLFIDTMSFNLLMMRYAAVLQDPMHDASDQPRFRLELLDSAYNLIDPVCAAADFIANRNLGWNEAADNVLWKDWTPVGIDVSAYAGQQVYVRLTTYDCNEGSHYGYAYFTLECMRKSIDAETCGNVDSNRFTAPAGFNYRWYTATSPTTISTERSLVVPTADMATYFCDLTFVGNASCNFTLSAFGGPRLPLARVDTTVSITDCHFDVQFTNRSTVSPDGITPAPTNEQVETAFWDFGNGETSNSYHGHTVYDTIGIYTVTLIIGISGGACTDTLVWPMRVEPPTYPYITGPDRLCFGDTDTLRLYGGIPYGDSLWADGGDHWYLPLSTSNYNLGTNTYSLLTTDPYGCHPPASHTLTVNPVHHTTDSVRICNPLLPYSYRDTLFLAGTTVGDFYFHHTTTEGCDSNFHLWLSVNDTSAGTYRDTLQASICDNQSFLFYGSGFTDAGIHNQVHVDATGACDSIHTLVLDVRPTSAVDTLAGACDSFTWHGVTYNTDTVQSHLDLNSHNCDSVTTLHLTVHYTSDTAIAHTVVENSLPYLWNGISFTTDTAGCLITLPNAQGCDSLITFQLTVYRNHDTTLYRSLCEGEFPVVWNGVTFSLAEADPTTHTITHQTTLHTWQNADSSLTMHLQVLYNTTSVIHDTLLQNALATYAAPFGMPVSYLPQDSDPARVLLADTTLVGTNAAGCDSTVSYTLHVYRNYQSVDSVFICASRLPYLWQGVTFHGDSTATVVLPTVHGADSLATRVVTVYPVYDVTDTLVICPYRPYLYEDVDFGGPGTYDVPHTTVDGCDSMVHVTLMPRDTAFRLTPEARLADDPWAPHDTVLLGCIPSLLELRDTSASLSRTWAFFADDTLTSTDTLFSIRMDTTGIFGFQLIALSPEGCYDTVHNDSLLWVFPNPQAAFTYYPEPIPAHQPETQFTNASLPDSCTYLWLIPRDPEASYTDSLREASPAYQWEDGSPQGEYPVALVAYLLHHGPDSLTVTCTDTLQVPVVIVNTYLQFPNLVSPNGDGVDDIWMVGNLLEMGQYTMNELWIYDRTGMLVYHVRNIATESQFWDPNTTRSPDGTYYYRFSARTYNGLVKRNGVIEVVR